MAGHVLGYHHTVFVVAIFPFHIHLAALTVPFLSFDIIKSVISLLHSCLRFAMMLRLNLFFNHLRAKLLDTKLPFVKMIPIFISVLLVFGVLDINMHFLTFLSLIPWPLLTGLQKMSATYCKYEQEKHRAYEERVREVEHGCFIPLVFSTVGGMAKAALISV